MGEREDAWKRVLTAWEDPKAHDAFLSAAFTEGALGEAASVYRALLTDPAKGEVARKRLQAIAFLAEQALSATRVAPDVRKIRRQILLLAALVCVALLLLVIRAFVG